jgi:uncharacterized protein (TIGR00369 family)
MALQRANFILGGYLKKSVNRWNFSVLKSLSVSSVEGESPDKVTFRFTVQPDMCNKGGSMHGGALMTLVDDTTTISLLASDPKLRAQVTSNLETRFLSPAMPGDDLTIVAKNDKLGKSVGFSSCEIYKDATLVALGTHVKIIIDADVRDYKA